MTVFRVNTNKNYTVMSNTHLRDKNLSLKAKGLLSVMLSLPDTWDYSINGLAAISSEGVKAVRNTLNEIEEKGYLVRTRIQGEKGHFDYVYDIYEIPQPSNRQPHTQKGYTVKGYTEEDIQLINNELNIKELNKEDKIKRDNKTTRFTPPTLEQVKNYCKERNNNVDAERFIDHYTSNGWKVGRNNMKDWKAAIRTWERSNTKETTKKSEFSDISKKVREQNKNVTFEYNEEELNF